MELKYDIKFYSTVEEIVLEHYRSVCKAAGMSHDEYMLDCIEDIHIGFSDGQELDENSEDEGINYMTGAETVKCYKEQGMWGYADENTNIIHLWIDGEVVEEMEILKLIGHELGHLAENQIKDHIGKNSEYGNELDECRADMYGLVAYESTMVLTLWTKYVHEGGLKYDAGQYKTDSNRII